MTEVWKQPVDDSAKKEEGVINLCETSITE